MKRYNPRKDCKNLVVQTSASYALLNGQITDMAMDGVYEELGSRLSRKTLLPMRSTLENALLLFHTTRSRWRNYEFTIHDLQPCN